jgi:hypothetical protein
VVIYIFYSVGGMFAAQRSAENFFQKSTKGNDAAKKEERGTFTDSAFFFRKGR